MTTPPVRRRHPGRRRCRARAAVPRAARAADPTVTGIACGPNEGVTVVVDFAPTADEVDRGLRRRCSGHHRRGDGSSRVRHHHRAHRHSATTSARSTASPRIRTTARRSRARTGRAGWPPPTAIRVGRRRPPGHRAQVGRHGGPLAVGTVVGFNQNTDGAFPGHAAPAGPRRAAAAGQQPGRGARVRAGRGQRHRRRGMDRPPTGRRERSDQRHRRADGRRDLRAGSGRRRRRRHRPGRGALSRRGASYIGTPAETATSSPRSPSWRSRCRSPGSIPTAFPDGAGGTRDLLAELRSVLNPDGSFGSSDDPFQHAYALLALSRTAAGVAGFGRVSG